MSKIDLFGFFQRLTDEIASSLDTHILLACLTGIREYVNYCSGCYSPSRFIDCGQRLGSLEHFKVVVSTRELGTPSARQALQLYEIAVDLMSLEDQIAAQAIADDVWPDTFLLECIHHALMIAAADKGVVGNLLELYKFSWRESKILSMLWTNVGGRPQISSSSKVDKLPELAPELRPSRLRQVAEGLGF